MNTCFHLANANIAPRDRKPGLKLSFAYNIELAKKSGLTVFLDIYNFA